MVSISLCMIVKNEEDVLSRCLDSVKDLVEEIIIVDTGSTDTTVSIAEQYTDSVYHYSWDDNFAEARNFAFSKATKDFIMWLDADDVLLKEDQIGFQKLKDELNHDVDIVMMNYNITFDSMGRPTFSYNRERLMRRAKEYQWKGAIHEVIVPSGNIIHSKVSISHKKLHPTDPDRNLKIFEKILATGGLLDSRQQFYYARELSYHQRYDEAIEVLLEFLNTGNGWVENNISACIDLAGFYRTTGQNEKIFSSLCRSFEYDEPRAEVCCEIGKYLIDKNQYSSAIFWYKVAASRQLSENSSGFQQPDCYGFVPYMQLCVCYDKTGDSENAWLYHCKAKEIKPDDPSVLHNENYFKSIRSM